LEAGVAGAPDIIGIELGMNFGNAGFSEDINDKLDHIRIIFVQQYFHENESSPTIFSEVWGVDEAGNPIQTGWAVTASRIPRTATIGLRIIVEVSITIGERTLVSEAEYIFVERAGSALTDAEPGHICIVDDDDNALNDCFAGCIGIISEADEMWLINGGGQWILERRGVMIHGE
jgi:hypothetical protein